jgi:putative glycosyltransferase (TIGR04372 family)
MFSILKKTQIDTLIFRLPIYIRPFFFILIHFYRFFFIKRYRKFNSLFKVTKFFQFKFAGFISPIFIFFYPLYYYLKSRNFLFFYSSISSAPGHFIPELDWLLRKKYLGEFKKKKIIIISPKSEVAIGIQTAFGDLVHRYIINDYLFRFFLSFLILYKDLSINCNISNIDNSYYFKKKEKIKLARIRQIEYFKIRSKTKNYFPLKRKLTISKELKSLLDKNYKKYALIQIKSRSVNATARSIDPKTYIKSIKYLQLKGFKVIFAGREAMPKTFENLGLINYSNWKFNDFYNDICLVNYSRFNLTSASGFNNLADSLNIPIVVVNSWHIGFSLFNCNSIFAPSLIRNGKYFEEFQAQSDLLLNRNNANFPIFLKSKNCDENEIFYAVSECLNLIRSFKKLNYLQIRFKKLLENTPHYYSHSRISNQFVNKYRNLL